VAAVDTLDWLVQEITPEDKVKPEMLDLAAAVRELSPAAKLPISTFEAAAELTESPPTLPPATLTSDSAAALMLVGHVVSKLCTITRLRPDAEIDPSILSACTSAWEVAMM